MLPEQKHALTDVFPPSEVFCLDADKVDRRKSKLTCICSGFTEISKHLMFVNAQSRHNI